MSNESNSLFSEKQYAAALEEIAGGAPFIDTYYQNMWRHRHHADPRSIDISTAADIANTAIKTSGFVAGIWETLDTFTRILQPIPIIGGVVMVIVEAIESGRDLWQLRTGKWSTLNKIERVGTSALLVSSAVAALALVLVTGGAFAYLGIPFLVLAVVNFRKIFRKIIDKKSLIEQINGNLAELKDSIEKLSNDVENAQDDNAKRELSIKREKLLNSYIQQRAEVGALKADLNTPKREFLDLFHKASGGLLIMGFAMLFIPFLAPFGAGLVIGSLSTSFIAVAGVKAGQFINWLNNRKAEKEAIKVDAMETNLTPNHVSLNQEHKTETKVDEKGDFNVISTSEQKIIAELSENPNDNKDNEEWDNFIKENLSPIVEGLRASRKDIKIKDITGAGIFDRESDRAEALYKKIKTLDGLINQSQEAINSLKKPEILAPSWVADKWLDGLEKEYRHNIVQLKILKAQAESYLSKLESKKIYSSDSAESVANKKDQNNEEDEDGEREGEEIDPFK